MKTRHLKSVGLLAMCLGSLAVTEKAYAYAGAVVVTEYTTGGYAYNYYDGVGSTTRGLIGGVFGNLNNSLGTSYARSYVTSDGMGGWEEVADVLSASGDTLAVWGYGVDPGSSPTSTASCDPNHRDIEISDPSGASRWACFLDTVENSTQYSFSAWADEANIEWDGTAGYNNNRGHAWIHCYGNAEATARCIPISHYVNSGTAGATWTSTSLDIAGQDGADGEFCMLTGINGTFRTNSTSYGVGITHTLFGDWTLTTSAGVGGTAECDY